MQNERDLKRCQIPSYSFIRKSSDNGFTNPALRQFLDAAGVNQVLIMGVNGGYCVMETAQGAKSAGLEIITSPSLIKDSGSPERNYIPWFAQNGKLYDNAASFIKYI